MAFELNITHHSRHVPWGGPTGNADIVRLGLDLTSSAFLMNFATSLGGSPIAGIALSNAAANAQGISLTYDSAYVHPGTGAIVGATRIRPYIFETSLEALSWVGSTNSPMVLYYDMLITPPSALQQVFCFGTFTLYPGIGD